MDPALLRRTAEIAGEYLASLPERRVGAHASLDELRSALRVALDDASQPALQVSVELVAADDRGRMRPSELARMLPSGEGPAIVVAQVGEVNTGAIDAMPAIAQLAREHGAWCHVDGAFGLWAAASPTLRALVDGVADADSWATDAHKWLNVPYDCGVAVVRDRDAHAAAMNSFAGAAYIPEPEHDERNQAEWVPEFSRRARGFAVYAAIRELGRSGVAD